MQTNGPRRGKKKELATKGRESDSWTMRTHETPYIKGVSSHTIVPGSITEQAGCFIGYVLLALLSKKKYITNHGVRLIFIKESWIKKL